MKTVFAAACICAIAAAPAFANEQIKVEMTYAEADAANPARAANVLADLRVQARDACEYRAPITGAKAVDPDCAADALRKAVAGIGEPSLIAAYEAATGENLTVQVAEKR